MPDVQAFKEFLTRKAHWLVVLSWLMILPTAYYAFALSMVSGSWVAHNSLHQDIPMATTRIYVALAAPAFGLIAAIVASIANAAGRRLAASVTVIVYWFTIFLGGPICVALTPSGPQSYDRVVSGQHFQVPWHYRPVVDFVVPNGFGFTAYVCLHDPRLGVYDEGCRSAAIQVTVAPDADSESQNGLNRCRRYVCRRRLVTQGVVIDYDTTVPDDDPDKEPPSAQAYISDWNDVDRRLLAVVLSWKVETSTARPDQ
ncbi:hypothetical protein ACQR1H_33115 [Bradyrhizobium sp. HKCCYLRH2015]|uniref:hypothetical protein n=1 Tax=Bradyrhizobium sp. HKCCYLRH2015 TaxID=3420742 RepID=UPI003EB81E5D